MKTEIVLLVLTVAVASAWRSGYDCPKYCPGYDPVCATDGTTYNNECIMKCDWAYKACNGECPCNRPEVVYYVKPSSDCYCSKDFDPVCTWENDTFDNECEANCDGKVKRCDGPCPCLG